MRVVLAFAGALAALSLGGCESSKYANDPLYDAGFSDGCTTGSMRSPGAPPSKPVRDEAMWSQSDAYKAGWRGGYGSCSPGAKGDIPGSDRDIGGR
jgi:hypothetical protein